MQKKNKVHESEKYQPIIFMTVGSIIWLTLIHQP